MMIPVTALLMFGFVGCGSETGEDHEVASGAAPQPTHEQTLSAPGTHSGLRDGSDDSDTTPDATDPAQPVDDPDTDLRDGLPEDVDPRSEEYVNDDADDPRDAAGARRAMDRAQAAVEDLDDGLAQRYAAPDDVEELQSLDAQWWKDREQAVGERLAQVATTFRPGEDFNRDEAWVRASYLMAPALHVEKINEYPALDASWQSAAQCNADTEVFVEYQTLDEDDMVAMPTFKVIAEYRWVDGDAGCKILQPDYFYEYEISMDGDGLATHVSRTVLDETLVERPSGW